LDENDLWIAATALALAAVLISRDSDLYQIDGLTVEDLDGVNKERWLVI
jgi:predicted nucleic acid-binding protein